MRRPDALAVALAAALATPAAALDLGAANDYPTVARADYVFACMVANGATRRVLEQCACSIDQIASVLPYAKYVEAEAFLQVMQAGGEKASLMRAAESRNQTVAALRRAQAEADVLCFL
jgi:hypothetical protein